MNYHQKEFPFLSQTFQKVTKTNIYLQEDGSKWPAPPQKRKQENDRLDMLA